jgi:hypothetical protein
MPTEPKLEFLYEITIDLDPPIAIGANPHGNRQIIPLKGGHFEGPRLSGTVIPGGADWLLVRPDGVGALDVRGALQTNDGALIYVQYRGYITNFPALLPRWAANEDIPHEEYYFAITPYYETSAPQYQWLHQTVVVGLGSLVRGGVQYRIYALR